MTDIYKNRVSRVAFNLKASGIDAILLWDSEEHRDSCVRYLTGITGDAIIFITKNGECATVVWDIVLAKKILKFGDLSAYSDYNNNIYDAMIAVLQKYLTKNALIEIPPYITCKEFITVDQKLSAYRLCFDGAVSNKLNKSQEGLLLREEKLANIYRSIIDLRKCKDDLEITTIRHAASVTNEILSDIIDGVKNGTLKNEIDVVLFIERALRNKGCERTGFDTLCAGGVRSGFIHAHPAYTSGAWGGEGLSILDFGVVFNGYTSDVTLTVARGPLTNTQTQLLDLVEEAYYKSLPLYKAGCKICDAMNMAQSIFEKKGRSMPHTLGHGIGLDIHESPRVSQKNEDLFKAGMVVTLEPGLYDEVAGGVRWENDVLVTDNTPEVLTKSIILRL